MLDPGKQPHSTSPQSQRQLIGRHVRQVDRQHRRGHLGTRQRPTTHQGGFTKHLDTDSLNCTQLTGQGLGPLCQLALASRQQPQHWHLRNRLAPPVRIQGRRQRRQRQLADSHGSSQRELADRLHVATLAQDDPRLWPAQQLVAAAQHHVRIKFQALLESRLGRQTELRYVDHRTAANVVDGHQVVLVSQPSQWLDAGSIRETNHLVVGRVHVHDRRRIRADRLGVIGHGGPVRRADLV